MPIEFFRHHKLYLFDELDDKAKEKAIEIYRDHFMDFELAMEGDMHFYFSEKEWEAALEGSTLPYDTEQPEKIIEWASISQISSRADGGSFILNDTSVIPEQEDLFFRLLGFDFDISKQDRVAYRFTKTDESWSWRSSTTKLEIMYDEEDFELDEFEEFEKKVELVEHNFLGMFIYRGRDSIYSNYEAMGEDEYTISEITELQLLFKKDGSVGEFFLVSKEEIEKGEENISISRVKSFADNLESK